MICPISKNVARWTKHHHVYGAPMVAKQTRAMALTSEVEAQEDTCNIWQQELDRLTMNVGHHIIELSTSAKGPHESHP